MYTGPPVITIHPTTQWIIVNSSVTLNCEATGKGSITYQWETSSINGTKWKAVSNGSSARLDLKSLEKSHKYRCKVSNEAGSTNSSTAVITVLSKHEIHN